MSSYTAMDDSFVSSPTSTKTMPAASLGKGCLLAFLFLIVIMLMPIIWRKAVSSYYTGQIQTPTSVPSESVAVVFGAAVYGDGRLSAVLRDRMDTAITLYKSQKVQSILVSGSNQNEFYDEPGAMMAYAVQKGVPKTDIQTDYGGLRTYDTCYRALNTFKLESAILVTQSFHLPRAIFTCRRLGLDATGVSADLRPYRGMRWYEFRETFATLIALWDVVRKEPPPVLDDLISLNVGHQL